jgi:hypothetical protein
VYHDIESIQRELLRICASQNDSKRQAAHDWQGFKVLQKEGENREKKREKTK